MNSVKDSAIVVRPMPTYRPATQWRTTGGKQLISVSSTVNHDFTVV